MSRRFFHVLMISLVCVWVWLTAIAPAQAVGSASGLLLPLEDLPAGFVQVPASEIEGCRPQGDRGDVAGFILKPATDISESLCISAFLLTEQAANEFQASLMREMFDAILNNPQAMIEQAKAEDAVAVDVLNDLSSIGDKVTGFTTLAEGKRHDVAIFRQGDYVGSIATHYSNDTAPSVPLKEIAIKLDQHLRSLSAE